MDNLRIRKIINFAKERKSCSIAELMEEFGVSSATIHRDIELLAKRDAIERVRGGIIYNDAPNARATSANYQERVVARRAEKIAAARRALALVEEGDIVFLDSSTTVYELALLLVQSKFDHLTVITNAIPVMHLFRKFPPHWSMIGLGGNYDPQLNSILGAAALEHLSHFNVTKAFVSAFGLLRARRQDGHNKPRAAGRDTAPSARCRGQALSNHRPHEDRAKGNLPHRRPRRIRRDPDG